MRTNRHIFLTAFQSLVLLLKTMPAFASGREGEALVEPVRWIVAIVLIIFATLVFGGGFLGAFNASQSGESILKGGARGLLHVPGRKRRVGGGADYLRHPLDCLFIPGRLRVEPFLKPMLSNNR